MVVSPRVRMVKFIRDELDCPSPLVVEDRFVVDRSPFTLTFFPLEADNGTVWDWKVEVSYGNRKMGSLQSNRLNPQFAHEILEVVDSGIVSLRSKWIDAREQILEYMNIAYKLDFEYDDDPYLDVNVKLCRETFTLYTCVERPDSLDTGFAILLYDYQEREPTLVLLSEAHQIHSVYSVSPDDDRVLEVLDDFMRIVQ